MEFFRQVCRTGLPLSAAGDLPDPGIEPVSLDSPALADEFFTTVSPGKLMFTYVVLGSNLPGSNVVLGSNLTWLLGELGQYRLTSLSLSCLIS